MRIVRSISQTVSTLVWLTIFSLVIPAAVNCATHCGCCRDRPPEYSGTCACGENTLTRGLGSEGNCCCPDGCCCSQVPDQAAVAFGYGREVRPERRASCPCTDSRHAEALEFAPRVASIQARNQSPVLGSRALERCVEIGRLLL